jgi:hypothetical protein
MDLNYKDLEALTNMKKKAAIHTAPPQHARERESSNSSTPSYRPFPRINFDAVSGLVSGKGRRDWRSEKCKEE